MPKERRIMNKRVREVSGTDETPLATMAGSEIAFPEPMAFNEWWTWRSREGHRPRRRAGDASGTTQAQESVLWRAVLEEVHGPEWRELARSRASPANRERARRIVQPLQAAGTSVDVCRLETRIYRGEYVAAMDDMPPEASRLCLRRQWKDLVTGDRPYSQEELHERLAIVDELCREAGDDPEVWAQGIGTGRGLECRRYIITDGGTDTAEDRHRSRRPSRGSRSPARVNTIPRSPSGSEPRL